MNGTLTFTNRFCSCCVRLFSFVIQGMTSFVFLSPQEQRSAPAPYADEEITAQRRLHTALAVRAPQQPP